MADYTEKTVATPPTEDTEIVDLTQEEIDYHNSKEPSLSELKTRKKQGIKQQAGDTLSETDWYVIRNQEQAMRGQSEQGLPTTIADHRDKVRRLEGQAMDDIDAATTKSAVRTVTVDWPEAPEPPL